MKIRVTITVNVNEGEIGDTIATSVTRSAVSNEGGNPAFIVSQVIKLIARTGWEISQLLLPTYPSGQSGRMEARGAVRKWHDQMGGTWE